MDAPTVSVLMPVHNGERYLPEALESILVQSWTDFELVVVDDGSTDGSPAILAACRDPRVHVLRLDRRVGVARALNHGIEACRGRYIARMDADDISHPDRLRKQVEWMERHPDCGIVATLMELIDAEGRVLPAWDEDRLTVSREEIRRILPAGNCLAHPSVLARGEILRRYRYSPAALHAEDWELWLRMVADGVAIDKLPEALLRYRQHAGGVSQPGGRWAWRYRSLTRARLAFLWGAFRQGRLGRFEASVARRIVSHPLRPLVLWLRRLRG